MRITEVEEWMPGLFHGERTLGAVLDTLPGITASEVPFVVRFFENPSSKWSFPGAISLARHDCVHIMLGRGLNSEDEAFVLGFTTGRSDGIENHMTKLLRLVLLLRNPWLSALRTPAKLRNLQIAVFRWIASHLYPKGLRFSRDDLKVFDLGLGLGERAGPRNLENFPFEQRRDWTVADLRKELGVDILQIESINAVEKMLVPGKKANRLETRRINA